MANKRTKKERKVVEVIEEVRHISMDELEEIAILSFIKGVAFKCELTADGSSQERRGNQ